mgnify:CR=1 FL=1
MNTIKKVLFAVVVILAGYSMNAQAPKMNNAPVLENTISIQEVYYGKYFEFTLPDNIFSETDDNDKIVRYEASMFNGSGLPTWIYFNGT